MKKLYKYIVLVIGVMAFFACTDEMDFPKVVVESGKDVTLNLKVQTQDIKDVVVSRMAAEEERTINDLHIYIFDADGILTGYKKEEFTDGVHTVNTEYTVKEIQTKTGSSYIYAIANIINGSTYFLSPNDINRLTDPFSYKLKKEELESIKFNREASKDGINQSPKPTGVYMMSGYLNNGNSVNITANKTIEPDGNVALSDEDKVIKLYRVLAKNTLTIKTFSEKVAGKDVYRGKFTPKYYRLWNVPKVGTLIPNENIETTATYLQDNITNLVEIGADGKPIRHIDSGYQVHTSDSIFTFYYPENLQVAKSPANVAACQENISENEKVAWKENWVWKDRETNRWNPNRTEKKYIYADDNAAYIEIQGEYVYKNTEKDADGNDIVTDDITANVTYTIHLGDFNTNIQDFNVIRNSHYIYNVTINGVDDIKVEAQRWAVGEGDNQKPIENPYAEGLVINAKSGKHYDVDAHYEARVMSFTKNSIEKLKGEGSGYILNISTVFGNTPQTVTVKADNVKKINGNLSYDINIYDLSGNRLAILQKPDKLTKASSNVANVFNGDEDFTWIKFVRNGASSYVSGATNNKLGGESTHVCMYPGDQRRKYMYNYDSENNFTGRTVQFEGGWMNVFELLAELYYTKTEGTDPADVYGDEGVVYYTCFIDENYYYDKSWDKYATWVDPNNMNGGKKEPRTMLIANNLDISQDGKSLYAEVEYSISQRPISTFYTNKKINAFGTELIDEEDKYSKPPYNQEVRLGGFSNQMTYYNNMTMTGQDNWNAWSCADHTVKNSTKYNKSWYPVDGWSDVKVIEGAQPLYRAVAKACMSRNRDLNGDGIITNGDANGNGTIEPEEREIRWYLAAIDQYRALFYAQAVLDPDAHLINDEELTDINNAYVMGPEYGYGAANSWNGKNNRGQDIDQNGHDYRGQYHYWTSSASNYAGTFWPEEGCTNNKATTNSFVQRAELIRCIRTLQSGKSEQESYGTTNPDKYYDFNKNGDNKFEMHSITVSRGYYDGPLEIHNEREPANELYANFIVATNNLSVTHTNTLRDGSDPCYTDYEEGYYGKGKWRLPNQKEFALMLSEISDLRSGNYGSRTGFSGSDYSRNPDKYWNWHTSTGFGSTGGNLNLTENSNPNVRCVRDVK